MRERACRTLERRAGEIADGRRLELEWRLLQETAAVPCSEELAGQLGRAVEELGYAVRALPSGAGHDAAVVASLCPVAMLFVRCAGGISHSPAESVAEEDVAVALDVLGRFLELLASERYLPATEET